MLHSLKAPGTIFFLLFIGAMLAPPASAQFELEQEEVSELTVTSQAMQKIQLKAGGSTVECETLTLDEGEVETVSKAATEIIIVPTFTKCKQLLGQNVTVSTSICAYILHLEKEKTKGTTDFLCEGADTIEIKVGTICTYKIASQEGLSSVSYKNKGASAGREIEVQPAIEGLTVVRTKSEFPFVCPAGSMEGTFSGNSTWKAGNEGAQIGIWVD